MKSVVICGSRRYKPQIRKFSKELGEMGVLVLEPFLNTDTQINNLSKDIKKYAFLGLTLHHFELIRKADVVFVYNRDGYSGNSVTLEIGFACALSKPIYALEHDESEKCRDVLFEDYTKTPKELVKKLK